MFLKYSGASRLAYPVKGVADCNCGPREARVGRGLLACVLEDLTARLAHGVCLGHVVMVGRIAKVADEEEADACSLGGVHHVLLAGVAGDADGRDDGVMAAQRGRQGRHAVLGPRHRQAGRELGGGRGPRDDGDCEAGCHEG